MHFISNLSQCQRGQIRSGFKVRLLIPQGGNSVQYLSYNHLEHIHYTHVISINWIINLVKSTNYTTRNRSFKKKKSDIPPKWYDASTFVYIPTQ